MTSDRLAAADRLLDQAVGALAGVAGSGRDDELVALLSVCEAAARRLDRVTVQAVAALDRRGTLAERGYSCPARALADLLGWERFEARRRVTAAEQVLPRAGLDGTVLPALVASPPAQSSAAANTAVGATTARR